MGNKLTNQTLVKVNSPSNCQNPSSQPTQKKHTSYDKSQPNLLNSIKNSLVSSASIIKLVDSHTVECHNLCSVISHLYVLIEKPTFTFSEFLQLNTTLKNKISDSELKLILVQCCRGILYLRSQGHDFPLIHESLIYIDRLQNEQQVVKIMNPHFIDDLYEQVQEDFIEKHLASILKKLIHFETSAELVKIIYKMEHNEISLKQVEKMLGCESAKRGRSGLKLMKNFKKSKSQRDSIATITSNGSSLMIDAGDVSELMFKDFYEHQDDALSQISMNNQSEAFSELSHEFPKRYLKSKAFKKQNKTFNSSDWFETRTIGTDYKNASIHHITRDQSMKQNVHLQSKPFMLLSAKLVQSFVDK